MILSIREEMPLHKPFIGKHFRLNAIVRDETVRHPHSAYAPSPPAPFLSLSLSFPMKLSPFSLHNAWSTTYVPLLAARVWLGQHIPVEADREEVRDWVLSVCMDARIDQTLPPERETSGTLYQVLFYRGV